jgi:adenosylhomocysteine nucleosidase
MKKWLIIAAMQVEYDLLFSWLENPARITMANGATLNHGQLDGQDVWLLLSGIGKVNAGMSVALALALSEADYLINTGVAGGLADYHQPGDVVVAVQAAYHDFDTTVFGYMHGEVPGMHGSHQSTKADKNRFISRHDLSEDALRIAIDHGLRVEVGLVVSGDQFVNSTHQSAVIMQIFPDALCVEMEGAAIAHVAHSFKVPFLIIRSLSDKANSIAENDYQTFVQIAAERSAYIVRALINV